MFLAQDDQRPCLVGQIHVLITRSSEKISKLFIGFCNRITPELVDAFEMRVIGELTSGYSGNTMEVTKEWLWRIEQLKPARLRDYIRKFADDYQGLE